RARAREAARPRRVAARGRRSGRARRRRPLRDGEGRGRADLAALPALRARRDDGARCPRRYGRRIPVAGGRCPHLARGPGGRGDRRRGVGGPRMVTGGRVLVVDDAPTVAEVVVLSLERAGFEVEAVRDGAAALDLVRRELPSLVVLDLMLPGMDGLEV